MQVQLKIRAIQDGDEFSENLVDEFGLFGRDFRYFYNNEKNKNVYYANFVGIIYSLYHENTILFSMPKHYMKIDDFNTLTLNEQLKHIRLVMQSISKSVQISQFTQNKHSDNVKGTFSFAAYQAIYDYYQTYGLYKDTKVHYKKSYGSHISWKKTIAKSEKYLVDNKLIIVPFIERKKYQSMNLITECMIFVFNYTEAMYGCFMKLPNTDKVREYGINQRILNNIFGTIDQLLQLKAKMFKDNENFLVDNLILFLKRVNSKERKVRSICDYDYQVVWENAVESYLNRYFYKISRDKLYYSKKILNYFNFKKRAVNYDKVHPKNSLEPDHYYFDEKNNNLYLFDSKYYVKLKGLNHKQLVYHFIFGNEKKVDNIYNALIIPTEEKSKTEIHVEILPQFLSKNQDVKIYLNYLRTVEVIKNFTEE